MAKFTLNDINNSDPNYSIQYELSGNLYLFEIRWNERASQWSFNLLSAVNNERLIDSVRIICGVNLLTQYPNLNLPLGTLFCIDTQGNQDPTYDSLGTRHLLIYDDGES